jgi:hypothetical protein
MIGFAFWSDRTGRRASLVAIQEVTVFIGALTLSIWPASFGVKMWGFFMLWLSCAGGPILTVRLSSLPFSPFYPAIISSVGSHELTLTHFFPPYNIGLARGHRHVSRGASAYHRSDHHPQLCYRLLGDQVDLPRQGSSTFLSPPLSHSLHLPKRSS